MEDLTGMTQQAIKNSKSDVEKIDDVLGLNGFIIATATGESFKIKPCSMKDIPILVGLLSGLDEEFKKFGNDANGAIASADSKVLNLMAEVIKMGIKKDHPELTVDLIQEKFSINDFPIAYQKVLDVNDFLSKMRKITQMR